MSAVLAMLAAVIPLQAGATGGGGPVAQSVVGSGSDTTQFMMNGIDRLYQFSPGCAQIPTPSGPTAWLDFSCQATDPTGTITSENYQHDQVRQAYFLGSSNGIKQLCGQGLLNVAPIDYARSSRATTSSDCGGLKFVAYARDAISWEGFDTGTSAGIHGMNNHVSNTNVLNTATTNPGACNNTGAAQFCLSQSQLKAIFTGCSDPTNGITNWKQVGGIDAPIKPYTAQPGSGTRSTWDGFLGGDSSLCAGGRIVPENSNTGIASGDVNTAIYPFSFGVWTTQVGCTGCSNPNNAQLGAVDNVVPTGTSSGTVASGSFPYGRFLFNVYCNNSCPGGASSAATAAYVGEEGWICKASGSHATNPQTGNNYRTDIEAAISGAGFVPLPSATIGGGDTNSDFCRLTVSAATTAPDPNAVFVRLAAKDLLGHPLDRAEQTGFVTALDAATNPMTHLQLAQTFTSALDYRVRSTNELYNHYLHRPLDDGTKQPWADFLNGGGTFEQIIGFLTGSDEYFNLSGIDPNGAAAGAPATTEPSGNVNSFVQAVYVDVLGRMADSGGLTFWTNALGSNPTPAQRAQIMNQFSTSKEYYTLLVDGDYLRYLRRAADPGGENFWVTNFQNDPAHTTDQVMIDNFVSSPEYNTYAQAH